MAGKLNNVRLNPNVKNAQSEAQQLQDKLQKFKTLIHLELVELPVIIDVSKIIKNANTDLTNKLGTALKKLQENQGQRRITQNAQYKLQQARRRIEEKEKKVKKRNGEKQSMVKNRGEYSLRGAVKNNNTTLKKNAQQAIIRTEEKKGKEKAKKVKTKFDEYGYDAYGYIKRYV